MKDRIKQYIYIVKTPDAPHIVTNCKIGKTNDLEKCLEEYNKNITSKSKKKLYRYLFTCQVANMVVVENDFYEEFSKYMPDGYDDIYFFNDLLLEKYIEFIKWHKLYIKEVVIKIEDKKD